MMLGARGCVASYALCFLVIQVKLSNSRISWRLNADKVVKISVPQSSAASSKQHQQQQQQSTIVDDDAIFDILTGCTSNGQGWSRSSAPSSTSTADKLQVYCNECKGYVSAGNQDRRFAVAYGSANATSEQNFGLGVAASSNQQNGVHQQLSCGPAGQSCDDIILDCGKPVNFTYYDNLLGISNRNKHPVVPEPDVAYMFIKPEDKLTDFDIDLLERRLKRAKREKPKSVQIYNQIGNFWRIKGNAQRSIECFRRALAVSPHNAEVLLNLARVLMALEYLDDATHLARRSLELQPPDRSAWEQYLTLGQIYKAYGHFQEAAAHLRQAHDLKPGQEEVMKALKEVETLPIASIHVWTLVIIVLLILLALLLVLSTIDADDSNINSEQMQRPAQRHFNRAMAMRSLRLNVSRNGKRC